MYIYNNKNFKQLISCKAFTLAEVLITLGIIGVIAAFTIPSLIQNTQNKELVVAIKKEYSTFMQMKDLLQKDDMDFSDIFVQGESDTQTINKLSQYLKIMKICKNTDNCWNEPIKYAQKTNDGYGNYNSTTNEDGTIAILADGSRIAVDNSSSGDTCGDVTWGYYKSDSDGNYILDSDGKRTFIPTSTDVNFCGSIEIDTNGKRGPNQFGKDTFRMLFFPSSFGGQWPYTTWGDLNSVLVNGKI